MRQRLGHSAGPGMVGKTLAEPAAVGAGGVGPPPQPPPTSGAVWVRRLGACVQK